MSRFSEQALTWLYHLEIEAKACLENDGVPVSDPPLLHPNPGPSSAKKRHSTGVGSVAADVHGGDCGHARSRSIRLRESAQASRRARADFIRGRASGPRSTQPTTSIRARWPGAAASFVSPVISVPSRASARAMYAASYAVRLS